MTQTIESFLQAGAEASRNGDWRAARASFETALEIEPVAEALLGLSDALWWLGELDECIEYRQRAYVAFRDRSDARQAALSALLLCFDFRKQIGNPVVADGWLERARRLIDEQGVEELRGWLLFGRSFDNDDPVAGEAWAREACEVARRAEDTDLELCAMSELGACLVRQGFVAEGVARLDEAMAASLGGECDPETVVVTSCNMMLSCVECAEYERAVQWVRATRRFSERFGCPFLYVECRVVFGAVLLATGEWQRAEDELRAALASSRSAHSGLYRQSVAVMAELRLAQGRVEEAERLIADCADQPEVAGIRASIELARGRPSVAATIVRRRLDGIGENHLEGSRLMELLGESELALGDCEQAVDRGRGLIAQGRDRGCEILIYRGERLLGTALMRSGDTAAARRHLEAALSGFCRLDMPYEAARSRAALAEAVHGTDPEVAASEAQAAFAEFDRLGAVLDAERSTALLRELGKKPARSRPVKDGHLTPREQQVLGLLGEGLSNPKIAGRLHLSPKTVEHHVSSVLAKLGLRNRSEAAAEAVRADQRNDPRR